MFERGHKILKICAQCAYYVIYGTYVVVLLIINVQLASKAHFVGYLLLNLKLHSL